MYPGAHDPSKPAVVMGGSGEAWTYGELDEAANRASHLFRRQGLEPGDHVAFCVENRLEFFALIWGARYAGLFFTACSTALTADELAYIFEDCDAKLVLMSARYADRAEAARAGAPKAESWFSIGGAIEGFEPYEEAVAQLPPTPLDEERIAGRDMLYSSGTTGRPKGIKPTDVAEPMETNAIIVTPIMEGMFGVGADDVYLSPAPLYHAAPLRFCMTCHQLGTTVVVMERWEPSACLELIGKHGVTVAQMVPTMFVRLLRLPEMEREAADTSTLRLVIHAAAPCPVEVKQAMLDWWGDIVHEYYSATEGAGLTWITPQDWRERPGTVGKAIVGVPHVTGPDGEELPVGEDGAIWFSDGPVFEYHKDPSKTDGVTNQHGWQTFGDIGHLDDDGYLYLTDRASYTIITGGVNVYPQEAEDVLLSHPKVMDAAVFGIPDEDLGEAVHAVIQPVEMPGEGAAAALAQELRAHCMERLSKVKAPRSIDFRPELPRTETGKLLKRLLKDEYAGT